MRHICVDNLGLGLRGLYSATNCVDNILGRFTTILPSLVQIMARMYTLCSICILVFSNKLYLRCLFRFV